MIPQQLIKNASTQNKEEEIDELIKSYDSVISLSAKIKASILNVKNIEFKWEKHVEKSLIL